MGLKEFPPHAVPANIFDGPTPFDVAAYDFLADRIEDWNAGRLRFPEELTPDQYEDWLIEESRKIGGYVAKAVEKIKAAEAPADDSVELGVHFEGDF